MTWFAHSTEDGDRSRWEPLAVHLRRVAEKAGELAGAFGAAPLGEAAGLLHDLGKYDERFRRRLEGENLRHDHSTAGACVAVDRFGALGKLLAYGIAGHHAGLANGVHEENSDQRRGALAERIGDKAKQVQAKTALNAAEADGLAPPDRLRMPPLRMRSNMDAGFTCAFFARMLFSCLVDADRLATAEFKVASGEIDAEVIEYPALQVLRERLDLHLARIQREAKDTDINRLRTRVLSHVRLKAELQPGIFTLTVPTGGGKTLTSLAFALDHAIRHKLDRVVYVIPFTSIIEQTADVFRRALLPFGRAVLEHHSGFDETRTAREDATSDADREARMHRRAAETWDMPVVVTTAVQFFESLYSGHTTRCRKLHNLARSVIVLDEAQTLPVPLLRPCVAAIDELARNYGASVVLCTATQPALKETDDPEQSFKGGLRIANDRELAPEPRMLYQALKRVEVRHLGKLGDGELAERLAGSEQALVIVNTRKHARELYQKLKARPGARHLSTLMCALHRREVLAGIRDDLRAGRPCSVVATSLIEAGVDVDFPLVYRAEAGLDSIAQAAGRCNREGGRGLSDSFTFIFEPADPAHNLKALNAYADTMRGVLRNVPDALSLDASDRYFRELYKKLGHENLDAPGILAALSGARSSFDFPFERIADDFRMIDDRSLPVIVPFYPIDGRSDRETVLELVEALRHAGHTGGIARKLQPYVVGVPGRAHAALLAAGSAMTIAPERLGHAFVQLTNADLYSYEIGLDWSDPAFRNAESNIF